MSNNRSHPHFLRSRTSESERICGSIYGLAVGDAIGKASEGMTIAEILKNYGEINDFTVPIEGHPISHGLTSTQVTDDTEQAILLAKRLINSPNHFDPLGWANDLLEWEKDTRRRGVHNILGPSTKAALQEIARGTSPLEAGRNGATNGAAMRITPVGLAIPPLNVVDFVDRIEVVCCATHNTAVAIAGAAAVAAMVSSLVASADIEEALCYTNGVIEEGYTRGNQIGHRDICERIKLALEMADCGKSATAIADRMGTSVDTHESIPTAFGIFRLASGDTWRAAIMAANIGGDTDTIGAMACSMTGAISGMSSLPRDRIDKLEAGNDIDFSEIATQLYGIRRILQSDS